MKRAPKARADVIGRGRPATYTI